MRSLVHMPRPGNLTLALAGVLCAGLAGAGLGSPGRAAAVVPSPPPGAPAVESAPSSLVGLSPQLPPSVVAASAGTGSHWTPEKAVYGTASTNDIAIQGRRRNDHQSQRDLSDHGVGRSRPRDRSPSC